MVHEHVNAVIDASYFNANLHAGALPSSLSHIATTASTMFSGRVTAVAMKNVERRPALSLPSKEVANSLEHWRGAHDRSAADLDAETQAAETMLREWTHQIRSAVQTRFDYFVAWREATITSAIAAWVERLAQLADLLVSVRDDAQVKSTLDFLQRHGATQQEEQFRRAHQIFIHFF